MLSNGRVATAFASISTCMPFPDRRTVGITAGVEPLRSTCCGCACWSRSGHPLKCPGTGTDGLRQRSKSSELHQAPYSIRQPAAIRGARFACEPPPGPAAQTESQPIVPMFGILNEYVNLGSMPLRSAESQRRPQLSPQAQGSVRTLPSSFSPCSCLVADCFRRLVLVLYRLFLMPTPLTVAQLRRGLSNDSQHHRHRSGTDDHVRGSLRLRVQSRRNAQLSRRLPRASTIRRFLAWSRSNWLRCVRSPVPLWSRRVDTQRSHPYFAFGEQTNGPFAEKCDLASDYSPADPRFHSIIRACARASIFREAQSTFGVATGGEWSVRFALSFRSAVGF